MQKAVIKMTETSCHQSKSPFAILMARSIIANPDRIASVSQIFRFALLLNIVFLDLVGCSNCETSGVDGYPDVNSGKVLRYPLVFCANGYLTFSPV